MIITLPIFLCLVLIVLLAILRRKQASPPPSVLEYWVYMQGNQLPSQDELMSRLIKTRAIGKTDALLFTHIGLYMGFLQRSKNPHLFHPDLFEDDAHSNDSLAKESAEANSLAMIRFLSPVNATDTNYLKFVPHLALAIGQMAEGIAIYDTAQKRLFTIPEFEAIIGSGVEANRAEAHFRVIWKDIAPCYAKTVGMSKKGLPELVTGPMESDEKILVTNVLFEAGRNFWADPNATKSIDVEYLGSRFQVIVDRKAKVKDPHSLLVRLMRIQTR